MFEIKIKYYFYYNKLSYDNIILNLLKKAIFLCKYFSIFFANGENFSVKQFLTYGIIKKKDQRDRGRLVGIKQNTNEKEILSEDECQKNKF